MDPSAVDDDVRQLLARVPSESYELYVLRIAYAPGPAGPIARALKLAELDEQLACRSLPPDAPPYGWARRHIAFAQESHGEWAAA